MLVNSLTRTTLNSAQRRAARLLLPVRRRSPDWRLSFSWAAVQLLEPLRETSTFPSFSTSVQLVATSLSAAVQILAGPIKRNPKTANNLNFSLSLAEGSFCRYVTGDQIRWKIAMRLEFMTDRFTNRLCCSAFLLSGMPPISKGNVAQFAAMVATHVVGPTGVLLLLLLLLL